MQLYAPVDLEQFQQDLPYLNEMTDWVKTFLAKPHPELGRPGPVCPFVPRALQLNAIRMAVIRASHLEQYQIEDLVRQYRDIFLQTPPVEGELAFYKAIMLIFPDIPADAAFKLIDGVQQKLKPFFVESGLMIGEFHQHNESPGLHNPDFRPLRSPIPMLAIRYMAESDLPFLNRLTDDPQVRARYLQAYIEQLSTIIKDQRKLEQARQALVQLQQEPSSLPPVPKASKCPFARLAAVFS
jgi:hypothetical protein